MKAAVAAWFLVATMMLKETGGTVTSASASTSGAGNAIDGSVTTWWSAKGNGQWLQLAMDQAHSLTGVKIAFYKGGERTYDFKIDVSTDGSSWQAAVARTSSSGTSIWNEYFYFGSAMTARYVRYTGYGNSANQWNIVTKFGVVKGSLSASAAPSSNFNLKQWYLSIPTDDDNSGTADSIKEDKLNGGYEDTKYFYTGSDGGMVFTCPIEGYKTSTDTKFTRTELREMLRAGDTSIDTSGVNKNNWVLSSAPSAAQSAAGGVDGTLTATLKVNHVTTTGDSDQVGRVIVGQIHGKKDEPCRLYYRKLPNNSKGSVYFASQTRDGSDNWVELIGSRGDSASNPSDGIALDEEWSYEIKTVGNSLTVTIKRPGKPDVWKPFTMVGYGVSDEYMYFKAGVYNQNDSGNDDDYVRATFYLLAHTHN